MHSYRFFSLFARLAILILVVQSVSCSDEPPLGDYRRELGEVVTNGNGQVVRLILDDGRSYDVSNKAAELARPDTVYRCFVTHLPDPVTHMTYLAFTESVGSQLPILKPLDGAQDKGYDPLKVLSVWRVERYINLRVDIMTSGAPHGVGYLWDGFDVDNRHYTAQDLRLRFGAEATLREIRDQLAADHTQPVTLVMRLLHDAAGNQPYYTRSTYISMPVYPFEDQLVAHRDSIALLIPTVDGSQRFVTLY